LARGISPHEIHPSARAVSSRVKQAAPENDPERRSSMDDTPIDDRYGQRRWVGTVRWVVRGSRLFKKYLGGTRPVKKVARLYATRQSGSPPAFLS
jgi:hypothetical protein